MPSADPPMTDSGLATSSRDLPSASTAEERRDDAAQDHHAGAEQVAENSVLGSLPSPIRRPYKIGPSEPKHCAMAKNTAMALARTSSGKISLTVRYAGARAGRGEEEDHPPAQRLGDRVQRARLEQLRGDDQQHAGEQVGAGDHLAPAEGVEQPPEVSGPSRFPAQKAMK